MQQAAELSIEGREITAERVFDAPIELVWKAFTDVRHLEKWWGPNGFSTTTREFDFRYRGVWTFTMHGPDGTDYPNDITYTLIDEPTRIEYDHGPTPLFHVTIKFKEEGSSKTRMNWRLLFATRDERDRTAEKFGAVEGLNQTIGRLEEYLSENR